MLRHDRRQEAVERLLGAAVGVIDHVRQGVHHGAGQRRRVADFEARVVDAPLGRHAQRDAGRVLVRPDGAGERVGLEHPVHEAREVHLHRVGFLVGDGLHDDDRVALVLDLDAPIDALFAVGGDGHLLLGVAEDGQRAALQFEGNVHLLVGLEVVVDVGRQHHLILLHEEARRLHAHQQVLARDDFRLTLADLGAVAHRPDLDLPAGEVFRHGQRNLGDAVSVGRDGGVPISGVREVLANGWFLARGRRGWWFTRFACLLTLLRFGAVRAVLLGFVPTGATIAACAHSRTRWRGEI